MNESLTSRYDECEDDCATCYHGVSMHRFKPDGAALDEMCIAPGCDCTEFVQMEPEGPPAGGA